MIIKFMFKVGEPSLNNRVYSKQTIQDAIEELEYASTINAYIRLSEFQPSLSEVVGPVKSIAIDEDGFILVDVDVLNTPSGIMIQKMFDEGAKFQINPHMFASFNEDTREVTEVIFRFMEIIQEIDDED